jgi:hypothetical protein
MSFVFVSGVWELSLDLDVCMRRGVAAFLQNELDSSIGQDMSDIGMFNDNRVTNRGSTLADFYGHFN